MMREGDGRCGRRGLVDNGCSVSVVFGLVGSSDWVLSGVAPQINLGQNLVGERTAHNKGWMSHGTAQVDQTSLCQENDVLLAQCESVDLWFDVGLLAAVLLQPLDVDLAIEVTDVANNSVILHGLEVFCSEDIFATGGGDEDVGLRGGLFHRCNLVALASSLESVDRINFSDDDTATETTK